MYVTLAQRLRAKTDPWRAANTSSNEEDKNRQVFRGFVGGAAFMTKKGYRGLAVETSWSKNIIFSFDQDDVEITMHALKSSLADLSETVIGGIGGSPYSIGDYGFFTEGQFAEQGQLLRDVDRSHAEKRRIFFSQPEWIELDKTINNIAVYGNAIFSKVVRGDNFGILALRRDAFAVAKYLLDRGIDPLRENEAEQDMFIVAKEAYLSLTLRLKMIVPRQEEYLCSARIRTALEVLNQDTSYLADRFAALKVFALTLQKTFQARILNIQNDIQYQKRCELLNEACPEHKLWNIAQLDKVQKHCEDIETLISYAQQKTEHATTLKAEFAVKLKKPRPRMNADDETAVVTTNALSPTPSQRPSNAGATPTGEYATPTKTSAVVALPPIVTASPSSSNLMGGFVPVSSINRTPARHDQTKYAPILGTISQSDNGITLYR